MVSSGQRLNASPERARFHRWRSDSVTYSTSHVAELVISCVNVVRSRLTACAGRKRLSRAMPPTPQDG